MSTPTTVKPSDLVQPTREKLPDNEVAGVCDANCPASARVKVRLRPKGALIFCVHHYRENELALLPLIQNVRDESGWID